MSFYLRTVTSDGYENNRAIGKNYSYVDRETQYDEFCKAYKAAFGIDHVADLDEMSDQFSKKCQGIVVFNEGSELIPLYKGNCNYIMTENGKTFSNLTYK